MKLKRYISLVMLAVYLFATVGMAVSSMSCHCVAMHWQASHTCCHHCAAVNVAVGEQGETLQAPCCTNNHSNEIKLYTASPSDDGRSLRVAVTELPATMIAEPTTAPDVEVRADKVVERRVLFPKGETVHCVGLRAPPVLA